MKCVIGLLALLHVWYLPSRTQAAWSCSKYCVIQIKEVT